MTYPHHTSQEVLRRANAW